MRSFFKFPVLLKGHKDLKIVKKLRLIQVYPVLKNNNAKDPDAKTLSLEIFNFFF